MYDMYDIHNGCKYLKVKFSEKECAGIIIINLLYIPQSIIRNIVQLVFSLQNQNYYTYFCVREMMDYRRTNN